MGNRFLTFTRLFFQNRTPSHFYVSLGVMAQRLALVLAVLWTEVSKAFLQHNETCPLLAAFPFSGYVNEGRSFRGI